jgi:hypothetical protein
MAGNTTLLDRRVWVHLYEALRDSCVARKTEVFFRSGQDTSVLRAVRIMAIRALALGKGLMCLHAFHHRNVIGVALPAQGNTRFLEQRTLGGGMRLVAIQATFLSRQMNEF